MGLRREVDHRVGQGSGPGPAGLRRRFPQLRGQETRHGPEVADVALDEVIPAVSVRAVPPDHILQALEVPGVGEEVQVDDADGAVVREQPADEVGPDETRTTGHEHALGSKQRHRSAASYTGRSARAGVSGG